jgi:hypothetical protein
MASSMASCTFNAAPVSTIPVLQTAAMIQQMLYQQKGGVWAKILLELQKEGG